MVLLKVRDALPVFGRRRFPVSFFSFRLRGSRLVAVEVAPPNLAPKRCRQGVVGGAPEQAAGPRRGA